MMKVKHSLTLSEKLNNRCGDMEKEVTANTIHNSLGKTDKLLLESVRVIIRDTKQTSNMGKEFRYKIGQKQTHQFYREKDYGQGNVQ